MKAELMRYRNDSRSFYLAIIGLALNACFLMWTYSSPGITCQDMFGKIIGFDILFNIMYLLIAFLTAEKVKTYSLNWCWTALVLGLLQLPRILMPIKLFINAKAGNLNLLTLLVKGAQRLNVEAWTSAGIQSVSNVIWLIGGLVFVIGSSVAMILCCVSSNRSSIKLDKYLKEIKAKGV